MSQDYCITQQSEYFHSFLFSLLFFFFLAMKLSKSHNIRNHPYQLEQTLYQQQITAIVDSRHHNNFTWLVFINAKWVPFSSPNQQKLEQTLGLGGTFVDITEDKLFPGVKRVRVFPKSNYLSYLGVKYRLSRVMQPHQLECDSFPLLPEEDDQHDPAINRMLQNITYLTN